MTTLAFDRCLSQIYSRGLAALMAARGPVDKAVALHNQAIELLAADQVEEALMAAEAALAIFVRVCSPDDQAVAKVLLTVDRAQSRRGQGCSL